jgi:hypothetical protein
LGIQRVNGSFFVILSRLSLLSTTESLLELVISLENTVKNINGVWSGVLVDRCQKRRLLVLRRVNHSQGANASLKMSAFSQLTNVNASRSLRKPDHFITVGSLKLSQFWVDFRLIRPSGSD